MLQRTESKYVFEILISTLLDKHPEVELLNYMGILFFKKIYLFIFRERERKGRRKRGRETWMCETYIDWFIAPHTFPTEDLAHNPGMCPDWESNQRPVSTEYGSALNPMSHTNQGRNSIFNV